MVKMWQTTYQREEFSRQINKYLKKIATEAKIQKNVSFHIARHSFAKVAKDNKVDNNHLKELLGHSNIKVTEGYMGSFETEATDNVMASIFGKKEQPKKVKSMLKKFNPEEIEALKQYFKDWKNLVPSFY